MKQHITEEQFWELDNKAEKALIDWMEKKGYKGYDGEGLYYFFLPTIGQMLEFLRENNSKVNMHKGYLREYLDLELETVELCDFLWEGVKEKLRS